MTWKLFKFDRKTTRRPFRRNVFLSLEELETRLVPSTNVTAYHQASPLPTTPSSIGAGVNSNETTLTPGNVNATNFGKLFATTVDGQVYAEPLYMENVNITTGANQGLHNVVFVATQHDSLYAIDATNGAILWHDALLTAEHGGAVTSVPSSAVGSGDISPEIGITATPVIDPTTGTIFVENKTQEAAPDGTHFEHHLYAINIGSGAIANKTLIADSIGDTVVSGPSVAGTGAGSNGGVVKFDALRQLDRPALTLVNGNIYMAYASHGDNGPYHGWVLGYSEANLALTAVFNANPNGSDDGIWQSGGALAYETVNGNTFLYFETGNGTFDTTLTPSPFNSSLMIPNKGDFGDSFVKVEIDGSTPASGSLDVANNLNGWGMHVADYFTPMNEGNLSGGDTDLGSGAPLLLPSSAGSAAHPNLMVGAGKEGRIYLIDRNNMGGYHGNAGGNGTSGTDNVVQETAPGAINGSLDTPTFFNGALYFVGAYGGPARTFTVANAVLSGGSVTNSSDNYPFPGSTAMISTNPNGGNAIVWDIAGPGASQLRAYDASQGYSAEIYTSAQAANNRDSLGSAVKFTVPTVADGEVFVGTSNSVVAYGLLQQVAAPPAAPSNLAANSFSGSVINLTWKDNDTAPSSATGYNVFQSTDGTHFTKVGTASAGATSFAVGSLQVSTKYYFEINAFNPKGTSAFSNLASATTTNQAGILDFSSGFAGSNGVLTYNGSAKINGTSAELTDGGGGEAGSVFSTNAVDVTRFSNQFTFQLTNANADGFTFTIQGNGPTALGPSGGGLGYGPNAPGGAPGIGKSVAVKFDLFSNAGEGIDSTGEYTSGASPSTPAIDLSSTGINLHSGDVFNVVMNYDGTTLNVTITDTTTNATASQAYTVNIPQVIGSGTGYVGFTGGTGGTTAVQNILTWVYSPVATTTPAAPSNLTGTVVSGSEIDISWTNNANNATGILIDRSSDGVNFVQIAAVSATVNTYHDTALNPGNTYYYEVRASNAAGNSAFSNVFQAATLIPPAPPTNLAATNITTTEVDLSWTNVATNATGIKILKQLGNNSSQVIAIGLSPTTTSYQITGLTAGSSYTFEVDALNSNGPSGAATIEVDTLPAQVTGVTALGGPNKITISWAGDPGAVTYNVYRTTTPGGEGTTPTWSGITGTSYVDTTAIPGVTYYYVVTAVDPESASPTDAAGEGAKSAEVSAQSSNPALAISAGGSASGAFVADTDFSGGAVSAGTKAAINTSGITNPPPPSILQHGRYGNFSYTIPNLTAGASYTVRLDFVEYAFNAAGARVFNVAINGAQVLSNFDIWTAAGGENIALAKSFTATASNADAITINFTSVVNNAMINGIEIYASTPTTPAAPTGVTASAGNNQVNLSWTAVAGATGYNIYRGTGSGTETLLAAGTNVSGAAFTDNTTANGTRYFYYVTALNGGLQSGASNEVSATPQAPATGALILAISAGGGAAGTFVADSDFSGGAVSAGTKAVINTSGVTNPPPQSVLEHGRFGNFSYTIPNLTAGASYTVRLDFVEFFFNAAGARVFDVAINGAQVLGNFDIWSAAGGENIALAKSFTATASAAGAITIGFTSVVNNAIINGIEIYANTPITPAAPTGVTASAGNNLVNLSWTAVAGATGYNVYRGISSGVETLLPTGTNVSGAAFTDSTASNGTQYFYYVTSLNGSVQSGKSNEVSAMPQTTAAGGFPLTLQNNTQGAWADNQIYVFIIGQSQPGQWSYVKADGTLAPINHLEASAPGHLTKNGQNYANMSFTIAAASTVLIPPHLQGARIYISLGSPLYIPIASDDSGWGGPNVNNPNDPNANTYFDWYEFTYVAGQVPFGGNTTQVDQFGFPMTARLQQNAIGYDQTVGITLTRAQVYAQYAASVGPVFESLANPYRILAPRTSPAFQPGGVEAADLQPVIDQTWNYYSTHPFVLTRLGQTFQGQVIGNQLIFTKDGAGPYVLNKPTTTDVLQCSGALAPAGGAAAELELGAEFAAAFNRGVAMNTADWYQPSTYYHSSLENDYAAFFHSISIDQRAYGFAYDDVNDQSAVKILPNANPPSRLTLGIGW
jgi:fibronectin type 3 domain-containing protein